MSKKGKVSPRHKSFDWSVRKSTLWERENLLAIYERFPFNYPRVVKNPAPTLFNHPLAKQERSLNSLQSDDLPPSCPSPSQIKLTHSKEKKKKKSHRHILSCFRRNGAGAINTSLLSRPAGAVKGGDKGDNCVLLPWKPFRFSSAGACYTTSLLILLADRFIFKQSCFFFFSFVRSVVKHWEKKQHKTHKEKGFL